MSAADCRMGFPQFRQLTPRSVWGGTTAAFMTTPLDELARKVERGLKHRACRRVVTSASRRGLRWEAALSLHVCLRVYLNERHKPELAFD